jgi:hypothetical protein
MARAMEAGAGVFAPDVEPVLTGEHPLAALEAEVLRPVDEVVGDPAIDPAALHLGGIIVC